ncbi:FecR domain-containing protein [Massilia sp. HP4]|uniref:FecR family protein n=1 Tax=Massilia sp. HP4 TaxID=2562316 RepID=UPI0010BF9DFD|nr:FecR domain-containing protein [Massilia sp. HP4]
MKRSYSIPPAPDPEPDEALYAAAAGWQVRRQDGLGSDEEAAFQAWLAADARRQVAYARIDDVWYGLDELPAAAVAQLRASSVPASRKPARRGWLQWGLQAWLDLARPMATAVLAVGVLGAGWLGWRHWQAQPLFSEVYATARGQTMDVTLPEGSVLKLDTVTRVEVALYRDRREVRLPQGQAMFTVKADAAQPFDVLTGQVRVTVVGTRFSVRNTRAGLGQDSVGVQVESGRVRVSMLEGGRSSGAPVLLGAGQYVQTGAAGQLEAVETRPTRGAMLWREGRVNFDNTPLAQAVAEFERYGATRLVIKDPAVAALRVNGSFDLRRADAFSKALPLVLPVRLLRAGGETEITAAQAASKK